MKRAAVICSCLVFAFGPYSVGLTAASKESEQKMLPANMVYIPGGTFLMGDVLEDGDRAMLTETPVHEVELDNFWLSSHEVTVMEYQQFVAETGFKTAAETDGKIKATKEMIEQGKLKYPTWKAHWFAQTYKDPVVWIAWEDAIVYCNWLSKKHGLLAAYLESTGQLLDAQGKVTTDVRRVQGFRLPTEAEWEYAAREGGKKIRFGNGKNVAQSKEMNFNAAKPEKPYTILGEFRETTTPVGQFAPNALGLYDMSGNAWEWCTDSGVDYPKDKVSNPYALDNGGHMVRGGNWDSTGEGCRVTTRINWWPKAMCSATGFRVARSANTAANSSAALP